MLLASIFGILLIIIIDLSRYAFEPCFVLMERFLVGHLKIFNGVEFALEQARSTDYIYSRFNCSQHSTLKFMSHGNT
jgi:hypothetical protein